MKYLIILTTVLVHLAHAEIVIVASPTCEITTLSKNDIKQLFMLKQQSINDEEINVFDRKEKEIYEAFIEHHMHKFIREMKTYWVRMLFTGKKIAPKKLSLEELKNFDYQKECYFCYVEEEEKKEIEEWKILEIQ